MALLFYNILAVYTLLAHWMLEQVYQYFVVFEIIHLLLGYWKDVCSLSFSFENKLLPQWTVISWVYCCEFCLEIIAKSSNVTLSTDLILHCWSFSCDKHLYVFVMQSVRSKPWECFSHTIFYLRIFQTVFESIVCATETQLHCKQSLAIVICHVTEQCFQGNMLLCSKI